MADQHSEKTEPTQPVVDSGTGIEIVKNVPMPPIRTKVKYPFHLMEIGDSFFIPGNKESNPAQRIANAASRYGKINKKKFVVRSEVDAKGDMTGARCWRVE